MNELINVVQNEVIIGLLRKVMLLHAFCVAKTVYMVESKVAKGSLNHETRVCLSHCRTQRFVTCGKKL